jgi:hypothetical protein
LELKTQQQSDLLRLSALTRLTDLNLLCWTARNNFMTDATLVAIACNLSQLRRLHAYMPTVGPMPALGKLTGLRELLLAGSTIESSPVRRELTPCMLNQLLPLTQLTFLALPFSLDVCPRESLIDFMRQVKPLNSIARVEAPI